MNLTAALLEPDATASSVNELFDKLPGSVSGADLLDPQLLNAALFDPARDVLGRSGKGLRSRLLRCAWELAGGAPDGPPELLPLVIELIHAGSLVIDDIEDDSPMRRGEPSLHRRYGVPLALNTGNWLYFLPLALLSRIPLPVEIRLALYEDISVALLRCHQGQALDLSIRITEVRRADVPVLVSSTTRMKTGSLMQLAAVLGARAAGGAEDRIEQLGRFGIELGVGLQMLDDWSGIGVADRREKGVEDIKLARPTWPWAWLAEDEDELAYAELVRQVRGQSIDWEAERVLERMRTLLAPGAQRRIQRHLDSALSELTTGVGEGSRYEALREEVVRLKQAFS